MLVSHPPLTAELGASQVALSLADALRGRGHDARAWSPEPLPADTRSWNLRRRQRRAIERFAAAQGPFDVIDVPAISASRRLAGSGALLVRSVQPELRYLWHGMRGDPSPWLRAAGHAALGLPVAAAVLAGWRRARCILCLGTQELAWMRQRFPAWSGKLGLYFNALPAAERSVLAAVRQRRTLPAGGAAGAAGLRYLWIGRWTPHKGTGRLLRFLHRRIADSPGDRFTIAGCGPAAERDVPLSWLRSGRVTLVPSFARAELPSLLASHQAGLFTSEVEGWGLTLNEMLESGLTVFATQAGAVADLQPFFPASLLPFPPPATAAAAPLEDLAANGYYERFSWPAIAAAYERQALRALEAGPA